MKCSGWHEVHTFLTVLHSVFEETTISSQYLSWSTASTCTGVKSVKKLKALPCTAIDFCWLISLQEGWGRNVLHGVDYPIGNKCCGLTFAHILKIERER